MSSLEEYSPTPNEMVFDCLPTGESSKLENAGKAKELRDRNEAKRKELKDFFGRNTLCRMPRLDVFMTKTPTLVLAGFEDEGVEGVCSILEGDSGERLWSALSAGGNRLQGNGVIIFKNKLRLDKPNLEFEKEFAVRKPMFDKGGDAIFVLVVNGVTHCERVYDQYYVRNTMKRIREWDPRRCMLVLTHADTFLKGTSLADHFESLVSGGGPIASICCMVYPHIVAVETGDMSFYRVNQQRSQLFSLADRMILVNSHHPDSADK